MVEYNVRTNKERMDYVLSHNFDDIKRSKYMDEIKTAWGATPLAESLVGEKRQNAYIAFDQVASFMASDMPIYDTIDKKQLNNLIKTKFGNLFTFEDVILHIVDRIYKEMYLSDYTFVEILKKYLSVDFNVFEVKRVLYSNNPENMFCHIMADKIMSKMVFLYE